MPQYYGGFTPLRAAGMRAFAFQLGSFLLYAAAFAGAVYCGAKIGKATGRAWLGVLSGVLIFGAIGTWLALQGLPVSSGYGYGPDD
ncbi:hypothetical protein QDD82_001351 [Burkholderia cepacia]|uniref:hypothetical protein n=1 Tax=Burkholderia cepacia complex TaxID=87882 RepID=UPI00158F15E9|nr:hypothetical protein [Burkholderia cenocepacia]EKS9840566.1 hypothetical protein [Burkholderia cepacia]